MYLYAISLNTALVASTMFGFIHVKQFHGSDFFS